MAPFEALYGKKCRTPLNWVEVGDRGYFGHDFIKEAREQVSVILCHLKAAQNRQKLMRIRGENLCNLKLVTMCT